MIRENPWLAWGPRDDSEMELWPMVHRARFLEKSTHFGQRERVVVGRQALSNVGGMNKDVVCDVRKSREGNSEVVDLLCEGGRGPRIEKSPKEEETLPGVRG